MDFAGLYLIFYQTDLARSVRLWLKSFKRGTRQVLAQMNLIVKLPVQEKDAPIRGLRAIQTSIGYRSFMFTTIVIVQLKWLVQWQLLVAHTLHWWNPQDSLQVATAL